MTAKLSPRHFFTAVIALGLSAAAASSLFAAEKPKSPPPLTARVPPSVANMPTIPVKVSTRITLVPESGLKGYIGTSMTVGALMDMDGGKIQPHSSERCRVEIQVAGWSPQVCEMACAYILPDHCDLPIPEGSQAGVRSLKARIQAFGRMGASPWVTSKLTLERSPTNIWMESKSVPLPPAYAQVAAVSSAAEVTVHLAKSPVHPYAGPAFLVNRRVVVTVEGGSAGPIPLTGPDGRATFLVLQPLTRLSKVQASFPGDDSWGPSTVTDTVPKP